MSNKSNKRKNLVEKGSSGQRPSVFERLGTKPEQREQGETSIGFCRHWITTGTCPFGSACKDAMHHTLISPSKQRAASKESELNNARISQQQASIVARNNLTRLLSAVVNIKQRSGTPSQVISGEKGQQREEEWSESNLAHIDEKELERRKQQLQRELDIQMKEEMRRRKISATGNSSNTKKSSRSSSSSSSTSSGSSSSSSGSSSEDSSSSRGHRAGSKSRSSNQRSGGRSSRASPKGTIKRSEMKKSRDSSKESPKKRTLSSSLRSNSRNRQRSQPVGGTKRRRESSSPDSSGSDRRKQPRDSQRQTSGSRTRGRSPSPDRKPQQDRKRIPLSSHDKTIKRRDASPPRKTSIPPLRGGTARKRSSSPRPRRRSPSPAPSHNRGGKRHGSSSRNASPMPVRRHSPTPDRKDTRRGHTPPSPPTDRGYQQRGGRNSRRSSPENIHRNQQRDNRQRPPASRDSRLSPERRPPPLRASSREPTDNKRPDWGRGRDYAANSSPPRGHHRSSPDSSNGSANRLRDLRGEKLRPKQDHERDRRRDGPLPLDKGRDKIRSRAEETELPSLLSLMTQHPGHFQPQPPQNRPRPLQRDEPVGEHRGGVRDRGRFERYESDRGGDSYSEHGEDHHRGAIGALKRGQPPRRDLSPQGRQQRQQKPRDWGEFPDSRGRDWERRPGPKGVGGSNSSLRNWGPTPGSDDASRTNRMLPPLSVRNAMQAARRGETGSPNSSAVQQSSAPNSPSSVADSSQKGNDAKTGDKLDGEEVAQKDLAEDSHTKEAQHKRAREGSAEDDEPVQKRPCTDDKVGSPAGATQPPLATASVSLDLMESDLSDISDDADDILNAEGVEEPEELEPEDKVEVPCEAEEEEEDEEAVEDILDTMDFEEISDGELEAEEARGGVDAVTVDWADLLSQTRNRDGDETREARTHRWQSSQLLARLGVSLSLCNPAIAEKLKISLATPDDKTEVDGEVEGVKVLDLVAGIHVCMRARKQQRESLFQLRDRRGLSAADDLAFRRQLNGLPAKKPDFQYKQAADPELYRQAVMMFNAKVKK